MSVEATIVYEGDLHCTATHGPSGVKINTDAPVDNGGKGQAFSPTDLVGVALGTCVVTIMGLVAKKNGLNIDGTRVHVVKEMAAAPQRRIATLRTTITIPKGRKLSEVDRAKLENGAKTCPVKQSLHPDISLPIEFVYAD
ncbi:MAG TPA: OsmC family protein [Phycisphaerae bacterium]|nr:OsmC family protein [Phycisphaerae bacterium]